MLVLHVEYADCRKGCARILDAFYYRDSLSPEGITRTTIKSYGRALRTAMIWRVGDNQVKPQKGSIINVRRFVGV